VGGGEGMGKWWTEGGGQEFKGEGKIVGIYHITSRKVVDISIQIVLAFWNFTYSVVMYSNCKVLNSGKVSGKTTFSRCFRVALLFFFKALTIGCYKHWWFGALNYV
jgi:hypothetical protein